MDQGSYLFFWQAGPWAPGSNELLYRDISRDAEV